MRIGSQFDHLKAKLEAVGFISNKKDKHSILQATIEYIAALECEAATTRTASSAQSSSPTLELNETCEPAPHGKENSPHSQYGHVLRADPALDPMHVLQQAQPPTPQYQPAPPAHSSSIECLWSLAAPMAPSLPVPELVADSTASFRHVFLHTSVPSLIARLDGTLVHANYLFHEYFPTMVDDYNHTLYALCIASDVPKMQSLVTKVLTCDVHSAQTKMTWQAGRAGQVKLVFVSVALVRDHAGQPANIQCTVLPMA
ncbi:hypothetical protein DYB32_004036 [Aphanomyces invadans]|nr:hypothetical protein DYB32_004036 [Aphanomyces invadans]